MGIVGRLFLRALIVTAVLVTASALAQETSSIPRQKEKAVIEFTDKTRVYNVVLTGKFLFVHDEERIARGEPCFSVYTYKESNPGVSEIPAEKPVVSFHCRPVERKKAGDLVITVGLSATAPGLFELREIQFAGTTKGHVIPERPSGQ